MIAPRIRRLDPTTGRVLDVDQSQPSQTGDPCLADSDVGLHQRSPTMNRRNASKLILSGTLAAPALIRPGTVLASNRDDEHEGLARFGLISLRQTTSIILLHTVFLLSGTQWWGINLQGDHRQFNEKRTRIGGAFGRLTRPTVATRLEDAVILGQLFMLSNSLFFFADDPRTNWAMKLLIAHRFISWEPRKKLQRVSGSNLSENRIRQRAVNVGIVALVGVFLMLLVNPVLNRNIRVG